LLIFDAQNLLEKEQVNWRDPFVPLIAVFDDKLGELKGEPTTSELFSIAIISLRFINS